MPGAASTPGRVVSCSLLLPPARQRRALPLLLPLLLALLQLLPPSLQRAPFAPTHMLQPVPGAARAAPNVWREGMLCDVTHPPYNATGDNLTDDTRSIQRAIDACGDLPGSGGTVILPSGRSFRSGSLWLRSNLTFRVEPGSTLIGSKNWSAYPITYTRSGCTMMPAHAGLLQVLPPPPDLNRGKSNFERLRAFPGTAGGASR